jgi:nitroreductase
MSDPMTEEAGEFFGILSTTRAMRRLKPDPIPEELLQRLLQAGAWAANSSNAQQWRFLVVRDPEIKRAVQVFYQRAFEELIVPHYRDGDPPPGVSREQYLRQFAAVGYLTEHFHEAPVWIVPCLELGDSVAGRASGASVYPAVQNILLAARALGLGATLTTRHLVYEAETEAALGLPEGVHSYAIIPIGYPMGNFGPVRRRPLEEVVFLDRWGAPYPGL